MKSKRADRINWKRIAKKRFAMHHIATKDFIGYTTLICLDEVHEPLWVKCRGQEVCIVDNGYLWLQHFPQGAHYTVTSFYNAQGEFIRWYIDICKQHYLDEQHVLWYDDLYLDLDVSVNREIDILDVDELDDALRQGLVSSLEYELAWREVDRLIIAIEEDMLPILWLCDEHKDRMLQLVQKSDVEH